MNKENQLNSILESLPTYVSEYFDYCSGTKDRSINTMIGYAYDLTVFFKFLTEKNPTISNFDDITIDFLSQLTPNDIAEYMSYLRSYESGAKSNQGSSRARKLSSLRSFMQYLFAFKGLASNPAKMIDTPDIHKKKQSRLDPEEMAQLLQNVENASNLSKRQKQFAGKSTFRDYAIIVLLSGTGIRVSELVNIKLSDIDFNKNVVKVLRKGGNEDFVYFGDVVSNALQDYIEFERNKNAETKTLFLSSRGSADTPITTRAVERLIKKFGHTVSTVKKITPHTLRRSFGTELYNQTGDIYMVADALGHRNVQVTVDHYTEIRKERKETIRTVSDNFVN